ncbi:putative mfs sugar [Diplodia seriata]|uniref:Putative mfs sugar n=1 Tax=Diplodia seriata TaxID=420778 RepID=A0A0G2GHX9_9PEZI|nr:putative mfs sugar [Diplodia seriata]
MTLFGYDQGVFSGVVVTQDFLELHDLVRPGRTKVLSTVTAIYDVGCFFGAIIAFTVGERLGRKKSVLLGTTVMAVGALIQTSSYSLAQMFVGRTVLGFGNGINTATAPIWQTETSQAKWRGNLVILEMVMNIAGFALVNWINYGLSFRGGSVAWRFPLAFQFSFIFILWATVPWLPESPRWLVGQGRLDEAQSIIAALEAKPAADPYVVEQLHTISYSVRYEIEHAVRWRDLLRGRANTGSTKSVRRLLLGAGTQFMQQFEGINIMSYYLPTVLIEYVGVSNATSRLLTACNASSYLVFSYPMRTKGVAVATATNWITNFVIVEITPIGIESLGWRFWIVWTVFNAVFLPTIYLFYPETANRSLEDLDEYYRTNPSLIVIRDPDAISTKRPGVRAHVEKVGLSNEVAHVEAGAPEKSFAAGHPTL